MKPVKTETKKAKGMIRTSFRPPSTLRLHHTHAVTNQSRRLEGDSLGNDPAVIGPVARLAPSHVGAVTSFGRLLGTAEAIEDARAANANPPVLFTHDAYGNRSDTVKYHPAYHATMARGIGAGQSSYAWEGPAGDRSGRHVARGAIELLGYANEAGTACPMTMTFACVPALRHSPALLEKWLPKLISRDYDPRFVPVGQKRGATLGMSMTEKQGGSDVRTNTTVAARAPAGSGHSHSLTGHKWFTSAPMSDGFLTLAITEKGAPPSCFLVPRFTSDGAKNAFALQRLKEKIGDRSNASSEVEYDGTLADLVGPEGRGVSVIIEMVNHTRLSCILGSTGLGRRAVLEAVNHANMRAAFGKTLSAQPLMRQVLADIALESEANVASALYLCSLYDKEPGGGLVGRLATTVSKFFVCKRAPGLVYEALECMGGNGYIEDHPMARLYRQAPLNSIWEGSGNVISLDILRAAAKEPQAVLAFLAALDSAKGCHPGYNARLTKVKAMLSPGKGLADLEPRAREVADNMALLFQAMALVQSPEVNQDLAVSFLESRIATNHGPSYGTSSIPPSTEAKLIQRATLG